jgi:hypothetical protein
MQHEFEIEGGFLEDLWLEKIQERAQVERLLEAFAARSGFIPQDSYRIRDPEALPEDLKRRVTLNPPLRWVCFSQGSRCWLLTGIICAALSRKRNAPVLWVNAYSEDGTLIEMGSWTADHDGTWRQYGAATS